MVKINNILAVDIGNSSICLGIFRRNKIISFKKIYEKNLKRKELSEYIGKNVFSDIILSSVNKDNEKNFLSILNLKKRNLLRVKKLADRKIFADYDDFDKLGEDRIANVYFCREIIKKPCIVFDFGTALNIEIFDGKKFCGGFITIGIVAEKKSILKAAKGIKLKKTGEFSRIKINSFGKSTIGGIEKGILLSKTAFVEKVIQNAKQKYKKNFKTLLTGGDLNIIKNYFKFDVVDEKITVKGIAALYYNSKYAK